MSSSAQAVQNRLPLSLEYAPSTVGYVMQGLASRKVLDTYHLILAPSFACNLRCRHCYLPHHKSHLIPKEIALALVEQWSEITLVEKEQYKGIFHIKGGEPFLVPYLENLIQRITDLRTLHLMMTTNGTLGGRESADLLTNAREALDGHVTVIVSLDGSNAETHDYLRGPGQFQRTLDFLRLLRERQISTFLNCVLHKGNVSELPAYVDMALNLGADQISFLPLQAKGFGKAIRQIQLTSLEAHRAIQALYDSSDMPRRALLEGSVPHILQREESGVARVANECVTGYRGLLYIKPDGSTFACPNLDSARFCLGNACRDSLFTLMARMSSLRESLNIADNNYRCLCTGERMAYQEEKDAEALLNLKTLQQELKRFEGGNLPRQQGTEDCAIAYCVSRNW